MRAALLRSTLYAVAFALAVLGLPGIVLTWVIASAADHQGSLDATVVQPGLLVVAIVILLVVALAGVWFLAQAEARRLSAPLTGLARQAERLGAGDARFERTPSGIVEIDQVADVLARSARNLLTALASERDFAADASHQLRTPLTALLMRLEEIAYTDDLDVVREEAAIAIEQVERLTDTVDTLLARTRHVAETPVPVRVDRVLAQLQRTWAPALEQRQRTIKVSGIRGVEVFATDATLSQVLATLIENALLHGDGTVSVDVRHSGPSIVIEVSDEGPGVRPDLAPFIFDRHVSTRSSGLGLGLARDLAEAQGGRLELVRAEPVLFALFLSAAEEY